MVQRIQTQVVAAMPRQQRKMRNPKHQFAIRTKPFALQPFCLMPVLPGETLKMLNWQSRCVTDPVYSKLTGWWLEYYWFYVKHRAMAESATLQTMMLTPGTDVTGIDDVTTDTDWYHGGTASNLNWAKMCTVVCTEYAFREEGEAWNSNLIGDLPAVKIKQNGWWDSAQTATARTTMDPDLTVGVDDSVSGSEVESLLNQWEILRMQGLTTQTYEEYLMTYGVRPEQIEVNQPELLRYTSDWQYPSNIVEPTTGVPTSAVSWSIQERIDKDRFFKEPGFIVGFTVARPKVYLSNLRGHMAALMNDVYSWLPATTRPEVSQRLIDNANAVTTGITEDFWIDFRDLLVYGDQFVNFALTETDFGAVALPTAALDFKYPTLAMSEALFSGTPKLVRQDGIATAMIAGSVHDAYPGKGGGF